ncbi:ABC transporter substrate-binding protein [Sedimentitalea sp. XS_ASV28]|uniref:ABC transporter substrate-binding protein n=1 Tax=Sedimentitalea sp. XS_ASV28 TaxID=3241296 RepID=UPI003517E782
MNLNGKERVLSAAYAAATGVLMSTSPVAAQERLTIATFGGSFLDAVETCHIPAFESATGATVETVLGNSVQHAASVRAMGASSDYDVVYIDDSAAMQLKAENLLHPMDRAALESADELDPRAFGPDDAFVVFMTGATAIAYNPEMVETPPTSWRDLFDEKYKGQVAIGDVTGTAGWQFLLAVNKMEGGSLEDVTPGIEAIKPLAQDAVVQYTQADQLLALFARGEVAMAPWYPDRAGSAADEGLPIAIAYPEEGAVGIRPTLLIPEGSSQKDLAAAFVDTVLSKEVQECFAEQKYAGPINLKAELSEKAAAIVPNGATLESLWFLDPAVTSAKLPGWIDRWQREVAR